MTPVRLHTFTNDGFTFEVIDEGPLDGPVVIALHGFPERAEGYGAMIPTFVDAGYRVLAPNQRGYSPGARPRQVRHYRIGRLAADILALADQAGATRFHVLGHDWGATVAWELAAEHPHRVATIAALSVPHSRAFIAALPRGQLLRSWYMILFQVPRLPEKLMMVLFQLGQWAGRATPVMRWKFPYTPVADAYAFWREPGAPSAALNWYRAMFFRLSIPKKVRIPTLYVWSTADRMIGLAAANRTARYVEGPYRFEVLGGVTHWIPRERPVEVAAMVLDHIKPSGFGR